MERSQRRLREIPCPSNNEGCRYFPECHLSKHHIYGRHLASLAIEGSNDPEYAKLVREFIKDPRNHVKTCRNIHDVLDKLPPYTLPPAGYMREFLDDLGNGNGTTNIQ